MRSGDTASISTSVMAFPRVPLEVATDGPQVNNNYYYYQVYYYYYYYYYYYCCCCCCCCYYYYCYCYYLVQAWCDSVPVFAWTGTSVPRRSPRPSL